MHPLFAVTRSTARFFILYVFVTFMAPPQFVPAYAQSDDETVCCQAFYGDRSFTTRKACLDSAGDIQPRSRCLAAQVPGQIPQQPGKNVDPDRQAAAAAASQPEQYRPEAPRTRQGSVQFHLPISNKPVTVTYEVLDGYAVFEGDILLGKTDADGDLIINRVTAVEPAHDPDTNVNSRSQALIAITGWQYRWPDGVIPFEIADGYSAAMRTRITDAIAAINQDTNLTVRARDGEENFLRFIQPTASATLSCASFVGLQGGQQDVTLADLGCSVGSIQHEVLHAAGAWHEHTRRKRGDFVTYNEDNVLVTATSDPTSNFDIHEEDGVDLGPYDYGSIMHYGSMAFGAPNGLGGRLQTLVPVFPTDSYDFGSRNCVAGGAATATNQMVMGQRNCLSAADIRGVNGLYPFLESFSGGQDWGGGNHATAIAFGDIDGDGRDEVAVARRTSENARVFIFDDATENYAEMWAFGGDWGSSNFATAVAFGDVDGDGRDELGITRRTDQNARLFIADRDSNGSISVTSPGDTNRWGGDNFATDIAFGDIDADGRDEIVLTRNTDQNARWFLLDDANTGYRQLASGGQDWGGDNFATSAAFGDVDGDGEEEFAVGRATDQNARAFIYKFNGSLTSLWSVGENWGGGNFATDVAFGDVDGDGRDEFGLVRRTTTNGRYFVYDDSEAGFGQLLEGGAQWGGGNFATSIAFGDMDDDGRDEVALARRADKNARFWVLDDADGLFLELAAGGNGWGSSNYATDVAFGDVNSDGKADLGLARRSDTNMRFTVFPAGE